MLYSRYARDSVDRSRPSRFSVQPRGCTHKPPYSTGEARRVPAAREQPDSELRATKKSRAALLLSRDASQVFSPWRAETFRVDCSDRDQISFAHVVARRHLPVRLLPAMLL